MRSATYTSVSERREEQPQGNEAASENTELSTDTKMPFWSRSTYTGSLIFNLLTFAAPALYSTLSKLWVANIDSSLVVTTDIYTYIGVIVNVLNDGIPRSAWLVIGDESNRTMYCRLNLAWTMITVNALQGLLMMIIFLATADKLAAAFVPAEVRQASLTYVKLSSVQALTSATEAALSSSTRALDSPDVPLIISTIKFVINIVLDMLFISKFHVGSWKPSIVIQAIIRLVCDTTSVVAGLLYFICVVVKKKRRESSSQPRPKPALESLKILGQPSLWTFAESAIRNSIYLWLVNRIIQLGETYATAWGVFTTIRWGLLMVPVEALEASTLTFVGHNWGQYRAAQQLQWPRASRREILGIIKPALISCLIALIFEAIMCIALSVHGIESFAFYLSESTAVAEITQRMWKAIDWTYIFYGLNYQLAAVLLATSPRWYLYQALGSNFLWMLPWAIVVTTVTLPALLSWTYYAIIFGGALVFDFFDVGLTLLIWIYRLSRGDTRVHEVDPTDQDG